MRFIVVGAGAVGGVIGGRLYQHGHDVVLVARGRHGEAIRRDGLRIESPDETVVVDVPAVEGLDRLEIGNDDVVLLAVKSQDTAGVLETLVPHAPPPVAVACAQNGIENERLALRRFANVYGVVVMCPSAHLEPGVVQVFMAPTSGSLDLGRHPTGSTEVAYVIRDAFRASTFHSEVLEDVLRWKYAKLVSNLDNAVEAVCGPEHRRGPIGELARQEGAACLHAAGVDFEEAGCAARAATIRPRPIGDQPRPGASSWQSLARRTGTIETDYLNGEIVLLGRLVGCPVPVNELLQQLANSMARNRKPPGTVTPEEFEAMLEARSHPPSTSPHPRGPTSQLDPSGRLENRPEGQDMYHRDRRRAERFGEEAERYDRARPGYPQPLADDLMAEAPRTVLDVGCGTGKAGQLFVERGCRVHGLEPDPRMAAIAVRRGIDVEHSTFEAWEPAGRTFDLLIAAQSWHWVDPTIGPTKAGAVLRPGGRIALFWTLFKHDAKALAVLDETYRRVAPSLSEDSGVLGTVQRGGASSHIAQLAATGLFERPRMRLYTWERSYTTKEWLDQLPTHSDHRLLGPERLNALLRAVGAAIDERLGGSLHLRFEVWMVTARRAWQSPTRSRPTR